MELHFRKGAADMTCVSGESAGLFHLGSELHCVPAAWVLQPPWPVLWEKGSACPTADGGAHVLLGAFAFMFSELKCAAGKGTRDSQPACCRAVWARDALVTRNDSSWPPSTPGHSLCGHRCPGPCSARWRLQPALLPFSPAFVMARGLGHPGACF